jgi:hypothetical protein
LAYPSHKSFTKSPTTDDGGYCVVRSFIVALLLLVGSATGAGAQGVVSTEHMTRDETVALVSQVLAEVQSNFPSPEQSLTLEPALVEKILKSATIQIMDLRDSLADNHFIQIQSFLINLPSGVSVEFVFPPEDRGE